MSARDIDIWDFQDCSGRMLSGGSGLNAKATFQEKEKREKKGNFDRNGKIGF